jgi:crossover junction endodeoxyribonuclease RuvC
MPRPDRILGIDPGLERIGFGAIERVGSQFRLIEHGLVRSEPGPLPGRLVTIDAQVRDLITRVRPDAVATERLLFTVNKTTAMDVAKALGVVLAVVGAAGLDWAEYAPPEVKRAVVGNGSADKRQVQFMVTRILGLTETPKPDDVADALAIALTHGFRS